MDADEDAESVRDGVDGRDDSLETADGRRYGWNRGEVGDEDVSWGRRE